MRMCPFGIPTPAVVAEIEWLSPPLHPTPCPGRMAFGYWPERLLHSRGTPRPLFLPVVSALLAAAFAALAFAPLPALFPLTAVAGFAYGEEGAG